jgi:hypothetical protein
MLRVYVYVYIYVYVYVYVYVVGGHDGDFPFLPVSSLVVSANRPSWWLWKSTFASISCRARPWP